MYRTREIEEIQEDMPFGSSSGIETKGETSESSALNSLKIYTLEELAIESGNNVFSNSFLKNCNTHEGTRLFTFRELAEATNNFNRNTILGQGAFGDVHKGTFANGQEVTVKKNITNVRHGEEVFKTEILMLTLLHHPNIINLIGYCVEGVERVLVYEFMREGTLADHLHDPPPEKKLDWRTRMKIATGVARAMEYLHSSTRLEIPPVFFKDLKPTNILLDEEFRPKMSDFGTAKFAPASSKEQKSMLASDISSFGIFLLQLITGRKEIDMTRTKDQYINSWAHPLLEDRSKHPEMVDPNLQNDGYPMEGVSNVLDMAYRCMLYRVVEPPTISEMVNILSELVDHVEVVPDHQRDVIEEDGRRNRDDGEEVERSTSKTCFGCVPL